MFSGYNEIKLEVSNRRKTRELTNKWKFEEKITLNYQWIKKDITRRSRKYFEMNGNVNKERQNLRYVVKCCLQENLY